MGQFYAGRLYMASPECPTWTQLGSNNLIFDRTTLAADIRPDGTEIIYVAYNSGSGLVEFRSDPFTGASTLLDSISATSFLGAGVAVDSSTGTIYGFASPSLGTITMRNVTTASTIATITSLGTIDGEYDRARWSPTNGSVFLQTTTGLHQVTTSGSPTTLVTRSTNYFGKLGPPGPDGGIYYWDSGLRHWDATNGDTAIGSFGQAGFAHVTPANHLYGMVSGNVVKVNGSTFTAEITQCAGAPAPDWSLGWWKQTAIPTDNYAATRHLFWWSDDTGEFYAWTVTGG